jgi:hypothetical protein
VPVVAVTQAMLRCQRKPAATAFWGAQDAFVWTKESAGLDFSAEIAVPTSDIDIHVHIDQGCSPQKPIEGVRLVLLANHWSLKDTSPKDA